MGIWSEPGAVYFREAMEQLGIESDDLEKVDNPHVSTPIGDYPTLDRVYEKAWQLREADE